MNKGIEICNRLHRLNKSLKDGTLLNVTTVKRTTCGDTTAFTFEKKEIAMGKKRAKKTVAKTLPATMRFQDRIKERVTAAVINMTFLTLLFEFLMAAFESSEPNAARITRRLANPNPWHRARMVRNVRRDADGQLSRKESRQMVSAVIAEANENPIDTAAMVQEGIDEIKRLRTLELVA